MGFGLLLIGYMFSFVVTAGLGDYLFGGLLIGSIFMFLGLKELRKYDPVFLYAYIGNFGIFLSGILYLALFLIDLIVFKGAETTPLAFTVFEYSVRVFKIITCIFFEISMLYGIADLSKRVDYPDTRSKAYRNMIFVGAFNLFQIGLLIASIFGFSSSILMVLLMLVQVIYSICNALLLFKCYAMICPADEVEMKQKKSRFAFVNKFREVRDAKEEKAAREMKEYYEEKQRKKNAKKKSKNSAKSKKK